MLDMAGTTHWWRSLEVSHFDRNQHRPKRSDDLVRGYQGFAWTVSGILESRGEKKKPKTSNFRTGQHNASMTTFLKWLPSLMDGMLVNILFWLMTNRPCSSTKRSLFTRSKSEQFLTGKKRDLWTLTQQGLWKCLIAEPAAVWSWKPWSFHSHERGNSHRSRPGEWPVRRREFLSWK